VRVAVTDAQHLDFCGHHYAEHAMTLLAAGYRVLDRRGLACRAWICRGPERIPPTRLP